MGERRAGDSLAIGLVAALVVGVGILIVGAPRRPDAAPVEAPELVTTETAELTPTTAAPEVAGTVPGGAHVNVRLVRSRNAPPRRDPDEIRRRLLQGAPGTYIGDLLAAQDSQLTRWPDNTLLRVWIARRAQVANFDAALADTVRSAFGAWADVSPQVRFEFVDDSAAADVRVTWVDRFAEGDAIGQTSQSWDQYRWLVAGRITIATHTTNGVPLDAALLRATALHEVGHLLGLGHSASSSDIMCAEANALELSRADLATMRLLYVLPPGPIGAGVRR